MENELIVLDFEKVNALKVFSEKGGLDEIIEFIEKQARSEVVDISTKKGRDRIGSIAREIGSKKASMEKMAMKLTEDWRSKTKAVNDSKKNLKERLDALRDEIKKPLDDFKRIEEERVKKYENLIKKMVEILSWAVEPSTNRTVCTIQKAILKVREILDNQDTWEEFAARAKLTHDDVIVKLESLLSERIKYEAEQEELEKLREQAAAQKVKDREEEIREEAAESARLEAEQKAQREKEAIEAQAKAETQRHEREKAAMEAQARAEIERLERENEDAIAKAQRVEQEKQEVVQKERDRAKSEYQAKEQADFERKADDEHRVYVENDARSDLSAALKDMIATNDIEDIEEVIAVCWDVVAAISEGKIRNVTINY